MSKDKDQPSTQWHPLFAELLRPLLQDFFDVQTNLPVGDAPRQADIVVLRRTGDVPTPFTGLWRHLTAWNVLEFKGPTVSAPVRDLDLLVELGLGIDRRLNEERARQRLRPLDPREVSFWYLTNQPGRRFLRDARQRLGELAQVGEGLWRSQVMQRLVYLVSNSTVPVDRETAPVLLVSDAPAERYLAVARVIVQQPDFWDTYAPFLAALHPELWKEIARMAQRKHKGPQFDLSPLIEEMGSGEILKQTIEKIGVEEFIAGFKRAKILERMSPKQREKLKALFE